MGWDKNYSALASSAELSSFLPVFANLQDPHIGCVQLKTVQKVQTVLNMINISNNLLTHGICFAGYKNYF